MLTSEVVSTGNISKIVIWGPPSSGKSFLSVRMGKRYKIDNIIHTDDYLTWDPTRKWVFMPRDDFLAKINPLLSKTSWIVDGNLGEYVTREKVIEMADIVIILNPGYFTLFCRIITRGLARNTWIRLGIHTDENATILGRFTIRDVLWEIIDSIRTVASFKRSYIHYLLGLAQTSSQRSKIKIVQ